MYNANIRLIVKKDFRTGEFLRHVYRIVHLVLHHLTCGTEHAEFFLL
jgi:hypothetical protein